jgi:hypothetical protein
MSFPDFATQGLGRLASWRTHLAGRGPSTQLLRVLTCAHVNYTLEIRGGRWQKQNHQTQAEVAIRTSFLIPGTSG